MRSVEFSGRSGITLMRVALASTGWVRMKSRTRRKKGRVSTG